MYADKEEMLREHITDLHGKVDTLDNRMRLEFGALNDRINATQRMMGHGFDNLKSQINALRDEMNGKFGEAEKRFGEVDSKLEVIISLLKK